jgi:hypothetical protein
MRSSTEAMSPYRPVLSSGSPRAGMAVVTKTRSPQITGLEWPIPGKGVFQAMFSPDTTSQVVGGLASGSWPLACDPRNDGQFSAAADGRAQADASRSPASGLIIVCMELITIRSFVQDSGIHDRTRRHPPHHTSTLSSSPRKQLPSASSWWTWRPSAASQTSFPCMHRSCPRRGI